MANYRIYLCILLVIAGSSSLSSGAGAGMTRELFGRVMTVRTTEPGVQLYTANGMRGVKGKGGKVYDRHHGFCLETQHFSDSPNKPHFPSTVLRPGQKYSTMTVFMFSIR